MKNEYKKIKKEIFKNIDELFIFFEEDLKSIIINKLFYIKNEKRMLKAFMEFKIIEEVQESENIPKIEEIKKRTVTNEKKN